MADDWRSEVREGRRFRFGANWSRYAKRLTDDQVRRSRESLSALVGLEDLSGLTFLDVGAGSGLSSLAAGELGAQVRSFDYDAEAVATAERLRDERRPGDISWIIERGSVLDAGYLATLGTYDVVYSWGVLHHTGAMWQAIDNVLPLVKAGGLLALAIYNDQGRRSRSALAMKRRYVNSGRLGRAAILARFAIVQQAKALAIDLLRRRNPITRYRARERGMSVWHDIVDWVGGYPFEVAKPEEVLSAIRPHGFELIAMRTAGGGSGNNEFLFRRLAPQAGISVPT